MLSTHSDRTKQHRANLLFTLCLIIYIVCMLLKLHVLGYANGTRVCRLVDRIKVSDP